MPVRRRSGETQERRWPGQGWDPFGELQNLWGEMGRLLDWVPAPSSGEGWMPLAEQQEHEDAYLVRVELPGIPQQNVSVEVDDEQLSITGEVDEHQEQANVLRRRAGRFEYRTNLPRGVDAEAVTADLKDGILTVRIPKTGQATRRRVEVTGDSQGTGADTHV